MTHERLEHVLQFDTRSVHPSLVHQEHGLRLDTTAQELIATHRDAESLVVPETTPLRLLADPIWAGDSYGSKAPGASVE